MLDALSRKFDQILKKLRGHGVLTEQNIADALKEVRLALLEADVNFKIVKEFIERVRVKAVGQEVLQSLAPGQQVIKIVWDELRDLMGREQSGVKLASEPPTIIMMVGLQGAGKTTTCGKLARQFKHQGKRVLLVAGFADIYAAGDVTGLHQHTPAAWYEGRLAAENALLGNRRAADFSLFPTATFTIPAIAQVGLTEASARQQGFTVGVSRTPFEDSSAAAVRNETEGFVKVVFDQTSGRILGVHILGPGAEDLIHVAAVAMRGSLTREALTGMHYVFPTLAGSVFDAMWD